MKRSFIVLSALLLTVPLLAADKSDNFQPLSTSVQQEDTGGFEQSYNAVVKVGESQFAFLLPEGFRLGGDPAHGALQINNTRMGTGMTFAVFFPGGEKPDRATLLGRYPKGRVVFEFDRPVLGRNAHVCDIEWTAANNILAKTRVVFVQTKAGLLEITCTCSLKQFRDGEHSLNLLLKSLTDDWKALQKSLPHGPKVS